MGEKVARKRGAPPKYRPEFVQLAHNYCLLGATNKKLAELFEVDVITIERWLREKPDFRRSVREGRVEADANVAKSLYKRATGGVRKEQQAIKVKTTKDGKPAEEVVTVTLEKEELADVRAAQFWLWNRNPERWKNRQEVQHSGDVTLTVRAVLDELDGRSKGPSQYRTIEGEAKRIDGDNDQG